VLRPRTKAEREELERLTGSRSVVPLDDWLGVSGLPFKMSAGAMLAVAFWAQNQGSYRRAEGILGGLGMAVNDTTVREVANHVGNLVFGEDCRRAEETMARYDRCGIPFPRDREGVLYIETDGAALNTRQKDENNSTWRENKLGEVFTSDDIRTWTDRHGEPQRALTRREYTSYIGPAEGFKKHLLACAVRNGYGRYKETVLISDGATWIRNMKDELFQDAQQILDFYHLCENVSDYAKSVFGMDESRYRPWARQVCDALKAGGHREVLRELGGPPAPPHPNLYGYIENNSANIDYPTYIEKGYFIGSGAVESGNKLVLQQRLKQAGMRWNVSSAQPLLTLRSKWESNLWEKDVVAPLKRLYVG
jgi:hypothetical protein